MKKILIVTERFWPEEFIINDFALEAVRQGYVVTILTQQPSYPRGRMMHGYSNGAISRENWHGINIIRFKTVLGYKESILYKLLNYFWFALYGSIIACCLKQCFDSVFIYQTGPLTMSIPGIVAGKAKKKPIIIWTQDVWPDSVYAYGFRETVFLKKMLDTFVKWVYQSSSAILVSCLGFKKILKKYTYNQISYAPNWPLSPYQPEGIPLSLNESPVFMFAGNVGKVQNLENVIKGFAQASSNANFHGILRIVGDGSALESLKSLAKALKIDVDFVGRKQASAMGNEYNKADFLVLSLANKPIFHLTIPSKFQMYISVAKPILCVALGEVKEIVQEHDIGVVVDPDSPEAIANAFIKLANTPLKKVNEWKTNAISVFKENYNREKIVKTILDVIDDAKPIS